MSIKKYSADVTPEEMICIAVVAKLLLRLLIEYYSERSAIKTKGLLNALNVLGGKK